MTDTALTDAFVAISQVKARYCRTLDPKDWNAFIELFTDGDFRGISSPQNGGHEDKAR